MLEKWKSDLCNLNVVPLQSNTKRWNEPKQNQLMFQSPLKVEMNKKCENAEYFHFRSLMLLEQIWKLREQLLLLWKYKHNEHKIFIHNHFLPI